ncbi:hypothetical protein [Paenirhodobacter sp. CAU 1674]|uniref:hypothetical protein n=1 Tax=Paenirhodobacter sp. CAU 1674 TaxID=3032596 RepID=UPI0023DBC6A4|nr:hypothetical protein [Paenirhodobacter sp. CAU 1674]MDF2140838.1 hypothetical protein [Paenirhodobacter sp. CAU 1674]
MKKPFLISTSSPQPAAPRAQMSCANVLDGRGRGRAAHRRAHGWLADPAIYRADFANRWRALMVHLFGSREDCAAAFGVTFQTACNWWDGSCRPSGDRVALAAITWPVEFAQFLGVRDGA